MTDKQKINIEAESDVFQSTKSFLQARRAFVVTVQQDKFQKDIADIRKENNISPCLEESDKDWYSSGNVSFKDGTGKFVHLDQKMKEISENLCLKYSLRAEDYSEMIRYYIYFNKIAFPRWVNHWGGCIVKDEHEKHFDPESDLLEEKDFDCRYPISVRISPEASEQEIIDFVKKIYKTRIKPLQELFVQRKVKKLRSRPVEERNSFIYENREMDRGELAKLAKEKFGIMFSKFDLTQIIHSEKQKRNIT